MAELEFPQNVNNESQRSGAREKSFPPGDDDRGQLSDDPGNDDLQTEIEKLDAANVALQKKLSELERKNELLSGQLSATTHELKRITQTLGWRVLSRYGQWKYRHLLPVYKFLRLPPYRRVKETGSSANQDNWQQSSSAVSLPLNSNAFDIICFPIIDWDFRFQRPQQLMTCFANAGHRIFYVAATGRTSGSTYSILEKRKNVYEVTLPGLEQVIYNDVMGDRERDLLFNSLNTMRRHLLIGATATIVQLPYWWPLLQQTRERFAWPIIYDCMDHHAGFSTNTKSMVNQETELLEAANLVVATSEFLKKQAVEHNNNVTLVPNACDYRHFSSAVSPKKDQVTVGYYGAIEDWFDSDLVAELAERKPEWHFILIGATRNVDLKRLSKLTNVFFQGEKHYAEIPASLSGFDVAIIPFKRSQLTEATNPVKAYEILAAGKPLVSVPIPEMVALSPLVRLASTADEFKKEITAALAETDPELVERRRKFAKENTWQKRQESLAPAIVSVFPKASVIIVTYNNLPLNRLCLESIFNRTEWPNFEVIVVDNNSTDGTVEYLQEANRGFENLKVIFNDKNLGFAAANNIGLKTAAGDYLVLLNNDTVVTRSWLSTLIKHLHRDSKIGMIGPVTNSIGNEAKIEVGYSDLDEMPMWAANYVRKHDDEVFPIPMLAMFCVAMRKEVFQQIGLLDEQFGIGLFEDDDYAHRVHLSGLKTVCASDVFIHHFGQATFKKLVESGDYQPLFDENRVRYEKKWNTEWIPHQFRPTSAATAAVSKPDQKPYFGSTPLSPRDELFDGMSVHEGRCNICGKDAQFFYRDKSLYRESLTCSECLATSRYRSIARGLLMAIRELTGIEANSLTQLPDVAPQPLKIYDTQSPFYNATNSYPIPDLLSNRDWIEVQTSNFRLNVAAGKKLGKNLTNQNLENLSFPDESFDIVITSDVMEHVRLDRKAHEEIRRVLKSGGIYLFTVPHFRDRAETLIRVSVLDEADPGQDKFLLEKEYHFSSSGDRVLSYRAYGTELDRFLEGLGFSVNYSGADFPELGIMNTELFYCRLAK